LSSRDTESDPKNYYDKPNTSETSRPKPRVYYELEQKREYLIRQLMDVQKAIDAVNNAL